MASDPRSTLTHAARTRLAALSLTAGLGGAGAFGCVHPTPAQEALAELRRGRGDEAAETLRRALVASPDDVSLRVLRVRVLAAAGDFPAASREVDVLRAHLPPGDPRSFVELGHAYELAHRFDEALGAYDEAGRRSPSPLGPREGGLRAAHWGEARAALPRLEEAQRRGADDADLWHAIGLVRLHLGDLDGAAKAYVRGLAVDPDAVENLLGLASVAVTRGDAEAALAAYGALLAKRPRYAPAEIGRAWALARLGRRGEALDALAHAEALGAPAATVSRARARVAVAAKDASSAPPTPEDATGPEEAGDAPSPGTSPPAPGLAPGD